MLKIWRKKERRESQFDPKYLVEIVADAAISNEAVGDGRLIPLIILDTTKRPDLVDFFKVHEKLPPGDVESTWVSLHGYDGYLALLLRFKKPFEIDALINFELTGHGLSVDLARKAGAIYLQAGKPGDRLYRAMDEPRIVVELGAELPKHKWEEAWLRAIANRLVKEGMKKKDARQTAPNCMENMRASIAQFRSAPSGVYVIGETD